MGNDIKLPVGARILTVHEQNDEVVIWALVDPKAPLETRRFNIHPTGYSEVSGLETYIGTVHIGSFVWHVFEAI